MTVNTAKVTNRRELRLESLDELMADVRRIAHTENLSVVGNWTAPQIIMHLAITAKLAVDGAPFKPPLMIRLFGPLLKKKIINQPMKAGFKLPGPMAGPLTPDPSVTMQQAVQEMHGAMQRYRDTNRVSRHPVIGNITKEEWTKLQLRHAEMHLSFILVG